MCFMTRRHMPNFVKAVHDTESRFIEVRYILDELMTTVREMVCLVPADYGIKFCCLVKSITKLHQRQATAVAHRKYNWVSEFCPQFSIANRVSFPAVSAPTLRHIHPVQLVPELFPTGKAAGA
jgi:hypothetical protein